MSETLKGAMSTTVAPEVPAEPEGEVLSQKSAEENEAVASGLSKEELRKAREEYLRMWPNDRSFETR